MSEDRFLEAALGMRSKLYHAALAILWNEQDAADAMQEAMLKGWLRRGSLRDEEMFEVWFMRILVNQCRDLQRRQLRGRRLLQRVGLERRREAEPPPDSSVLEAIHRLPDRLRLPVLLYYFEGYSQKEIGAIVGATPEQVKSRVRQAREKLRKDLAGAVDWEWTKGGGTHE
ncbi:MAG: sigma-70 family RNA polymerase sigma factor [Clostridia bacterium]|nr:sigma-70 family RNA polymerase sigma factor [Clostridia bacterium]